MMKLSELCEALVSHWDTGSDDLWPSEHVKEAAMSLDYIGREALVLELESRSARAPSPSVQVKRAEMTNRIPHELPEVSGEPREAPDPPPGETAARARWLVSYWGEHPRVSVAPAPIWPNAAAREVLRALDREAAKDLVDACAAEIRALPGDAPASRLTAQLVALRAAFAMRGINIGF